jgi:hypothetical protein
MLNDTVHRSDYTESNDRLINNEVKKYGNHGLFYGYILALAWRD